MKLVDIVTKNLQGFLVRFTNNVVDFLVNFGSSVGRADERCIAAEVLICDCFKSNHIKFAAHAEACNHSTGDFCRLFNIVGSAAGAAVENKFLSRTSACKGSDASKGFFFRKKEFFILVNLHGIA